GVAAVVLVREHDPVSEDWSVTLGSRTNAPGDRPNRLRARILLAALDPEYPAHMAAALAALPPRSRGTEWDMVAVSSVPVDQAVALVWADAAATAVDRQLAAEEARGRTVAGRTLLGIASVGGPFLIIAVVTPIWNSGDTGLGWGLFSILCFFWLLGS